MKIKEEEEVGSVRTSSLENELHTSFIFFAIYFGFQLSKLDRQLFFF